MITKNVGNADRIIRVVAGAALAYGAYIAAGPAVYILGAAAAVALITGLITESGVVGQPDAGKIRALFER